MKQFRIFDFAGRDFPFHFNKGTHLRSFIPHTHDVIELTIITSGHACHIVEGRKYYIKKGDVLVIMPSFFHELQEVHELEHYNFMFDLEKLILLETDIEKLAGFQSLFIFQSSRHNHISHMVLDDGQLSAANTLCELIGAEWENKREGYKWVIKAYFISLVTLLARSYSPGIAGNSPRIHDVANTVEFIHGNLSGKITVSELAAIACLSERQYTRIFKEVYSLPPMEYVINCRLTQACRLIKTTRKSLTEIGTACGFGDKVSFSRLFKKKYSLTPGQYRKKNITF